jgi:hypothetical protein
LVIPPRISYDVFVSAEYASWNKIGQQKFRAAKSGLVDRTKVNGKHFSRPTLKLAANGSSGRPFSDVGAVCWIAFACVRHGLARVSIRLGFQPRFHLIAGKEKATVDAFRERKTFAVAPAPARHTDEQIVGQR